jgi:hypothetical protein
MMSLLKMVLVMTLLATGLIWAIETVSMPRAIGIDRTKNQMSSALR